jgi:hypothetical protein
VYLSCSLLPVPHQHYKEVAIWFLFKNVSVETLDDLPDQVLLKLDEILNSMFAAAPSVSLLLWSLVSVSEVSHLPLSLLAYICRSFGYGTPARHNSAATA